MSLMRTFGWIPLSLLTAASSMSSVFMPSAFSLSGRMAYTASDNFSVSVWSWAAAGCSPVWPTTAFPSSMSTSPALLPTAAIAVRVAVFVSSLLWLAKLTMQLFVITGTSASPKSMWTT